MIQSMPFNLTDYNIYVLSEKNYHVETKEGYPVEILKRDRIGAFPVVAAILVSEDREVICSFDKSGNPSTDPYIKNCLQIVRNKPKVLAWFTFAEIPGTDKHQSYLYRSKVECDISENSSRICVIEITDEMIEAARKNVNQ